MDINKSLTFVTEDEQWITKFIIGAILAFFSFLIIPGFFLAGYVVRITRNVMDDVDQPLPEWTDWGGLFMDGLYIFIAMFVYSLPFVLVVCCSTLFIALAGGAEGSGAEELIAGLGALGMFVVACLSLIWAILLLVVAPVVFIQYARLGELSACFQFSEIMATTRENIGDILLTVLIIFGVNFVLGLLGIIPIIGFFISLAARAYAGFVTGHLYGQLGAKMYGGKGKEFESGLA
ncbi:MAG TPA: DUF4013 domain-containing protein [Chloroflexi bacterium]|nr:DUF4013 domain-containing protein [Chloroflexota bacterium]